MCNPLVMIAASAAMQLYQGQQAKRAADHQARIQEDIGKVNAANQKNEATRLRNIGVEKENDHRRMVAEMQSRQAAQQGAAGIQLNTGSALQVREDTGRIGEIDALRIRNSYADQADAMERGAELTRINSENNAAVSRAEGRAAVTNSVLSAGGTVASRWYSPNSAANQSQVFPTTTRPNVPNAAGNTYSSRGFA